jgi:cob(I)alamin adenosyltransferase
MGDRSIEGNRAARGESEAMGPEHSGLTNDPERSTEPVVEELTEEGRARIREALAAQRKRPDRRAKGLVVVYTGNGKGKTTAALGLVLRSWGRDMRVIVLQFIKHQTANWGEERAAAKMGIEMVPLGGGFTWMSKDLDKDRALAREGWERCRAAIESGGYDLVVLDEITYCFKYGWLDLDEVLDVLRRRPPAQHVVLTGRDAPEKLIAFADLVTEMREIKHPYAAGVKAQKGIEF